MKIYKILVSFTLIAIFSINYNIYSQDKWWKDKKYSSETTRIKYNKCKKMFEEIGDRFNYSNVYIIVPNFGNQVYLNILNEDKGYYSSDQTKFILDNFITNNPVNNFKWRNSSRSENYAFATGKYKYKKNGYLNSFDISVSLKYVDDMWLIDQIIIN